MVFKGHHGAVRAHDVDVSSHFQWYSLTCGVCSTAVIDSMRRAPMGIAAMIVVARVHLSDSGCG